MFQEMAGRLKQNLGTSNPDVRVVIVSDYAAGCAKTWKDLRRLSEGWAKQDYEGDAEFLLCENVYLSGKIPLDLIDLLPDLRIALIEEPATYLPKNAGMQVALADLAVMLDANCVSNPD
jgi:hypothetical protein